MRTAALLLVALLAACNGDAGLEERARRGPPEREETPLPPVAEGQIRIRRVDPTPKFDEFHGDWHKENRWVYDWLEADGWAFFGWEVEAGSTGKARIRWNDPRYPGSDFGTISCELPARKRVLFVYGVKHARLVLAPLKLACDGCGSNFEMRGSIWGESIRCRTCEEEIPIDPEWSNAPGREFRVFVFGDATNIRGSRGMKSLGPRLRMSRPPSFMLLVGQVPRRSVMNPAVHTCDPPAIQRGEAAVCEAGTHVISRRYHIGEGKFNSHSESRRNNRLQFNSSNGVVTFEGTDESYTIEVDGKPVETADFPHPVWEFELTWEPS